MFQEIPGEYDFLNDLTKDELNKLLIVDFSDYSDISDSSEEKGLNIIEYAGVLCDDFKKSDLMTSNTKTAAELREIFNLYIKIKNIIENLPLNIVEKIEIKLLLCTEQIEKMLSNYTQKTTYTHISFADCVKALKIVLDDLNDETKTAEPLNIAKTAERPPTKSETLNEIRIAQNLKTYGGKS